jgi:hypothetical protein
VATTRAIGGDVAPSEAGTTGADAAFAVATAALVVSAAGTTVDPSASARASPVQSRAATLPGAASTCGAAPLPPKTMQPGTPAQGLPRAVCPRSIAACCVADQSARAAGAVRPRQLHVSSSASPARATPATAAARSSQPKARDWTPAEAASSQRVASRPTGRSTAALARDGEPVERGVEAGQLGGDALGRHRTGRGCRGGDAERPAPAAVAPLAPRAAAGGEAVEHGASARRPGRCRALDDRRLDGAQRRTAPRVAVPLGERCAGVGRPGHGDQPDDAEQHRQHREAGGDGEAERRRRATAISHRRPPPAPSPGWPWPGRRG